MTSTGVAQARDSGAPTATATAGAALKAGEFHWIDAKTGADAAPATGAIALVISLPTQMAYVYRGGALIGVSTVSTGMAGRETPSGTYTILEKQQMHRSNLYDDAPMPFMQRLTWDGIALHGGHLPGYPASHGCIRLPEKFARTLYGMTSLGATVTIVDLPIDDPENNPWLTTPLPPAPQAVAAAPEALQPVSLAAGN